VLAAQAAGVRPDLTPEEVARIQEGMRQVIDAFRPLMQEWVRNAGQSLNAMAKILRAAGRIPPPPVTRAPVLPKGRHGSRVQRSIQRRRQR